MDPILFSWTYTVAGFCAVCAIVLSFFDILQHLQNYKQPSLQRYIVRILWMVPIYAGDSYISLLFPEHSIYFDTLRDCYEAYVLYSFFQLLLAYLGSDIERILEEAPPLPWPLPFCCLPWLKPGPKFLAMCRRGVLQFVFVKPLLACVALIMDAAFGSYNEGSLALDSGYFWVTLITNISVSVSLYFLVLFSLVVRDPLRRHRPIPKFLCIKAVVFFAWWQGVVLNILIEFGWVPSIAGWTPDLVASAIQDTLLCIEMLIIAIAHRNVFGYEQFSSDSPAPALPKLAQAETSFIPPPIPPSTQALLDVLTVRDVIDDTKEALKHVEDPHTKLN